MKSNSELQRDVQNELNESPSVSAAEIGVSAQAGVITLTGNVPSYFEKLEAEQIAGRVAGVMAIAEELKVNLPTFYERTDADIAQTALSALAWNIAVPQDRAKVVVENSWVTLSGQVDWYFQKMAAEHAVQHLMGVKGVTNAITLKPGKTATAAEIKDSIESAFHRHATFEAKNLSVTVHEGKATLQGKTHSWEEKEAAGQSAWAAAGVSYVENNIVVTY